MDDILGSSINILPGGKTGKIPQKPVVNSMHPLIGAVLEFTHRYIILVKEWENKPCINLALF